MSDEFEKEIQKLQASILGLPDQPRATDSFERNLANIKKSLEPFDQGALSVPAFDRVLYEPPTQEELNEYQSAAVLIESLARDAQKWKSDLPEGYRPAVVAFLYGGVQIFVQSLSQVSFHGIRIEGTLNQAPCSILAHQSTIQLLCLAEKVEPEVKKNPIGFVWSNGHAEV